jgi:predicted ferric reductase
MLMPRYQSVFWLFLLTVSVLWFLTDSLFPEPFTYFSFRNVFNQYSGVLAISVMSLAMILSIRPRALEKPLKGLDKSYRLHKWLGIGALVIGTAHWWITKGTKWMVGWGWLDRPQRGGRPPEETLSSLEQFMRNQRGLAETVGEWAFYIVVAFIAIALIKRIPYSFFRSTHRWIGLIYLGLVIHAVILVKTDYWTQPIGIVLAALLVGGTFSAFLSLFRQIGSRQKVRGTLSSLHHHGDMIEANVQVSSGWPGHTPGQFAFVTSNATEGPHPYTIASAWNPGSEVLTFVIKQLGDWTQQLPHYLKTGMPISIEGPYGCFDFKDDAKTQIWIAGGVGITPFMAKLESLAQESTSRLKKVTLLYSLQSDNPAMIERVRALAVEANVPVNVKISDKEGRFSQEDLLGALTDPADTSVWFCGPDAFGKTVQKTYEKAGIKRGRIHKELFEMR